MCLLSVVLHFDYCLPLFLCVLQHIPDPNTQPVLYRPSSPDGRVQPHVYWHVGHIMRTFSLNQVTGRLIQIYFLFCLRNVYFIKLIFMVKHLLVLKYCNSKTISSLPDPCVHWYTFNIAKAFQIMM